jgi:hypothetical protein
MAGSTWKPVLANPTPNGNQGSRTRLRNGYILVRIEATAVEIRRRANARQDDLLHPGPARPPARGRSGDER